jgi:DNA-binding transcriptional LysR family regulator
MELRQLQYAVAVADELHFGRAAERLLVAQPSLSRQIRDLERDLGVALFARTSRRVELTPAGQAFVTQARHTLAAAEEARQSAVDAGAGVQGRVTLGFVASAVVDILPGLVASHRASRPRVSLTLREMTTEEQVVQLLDREVNVGIGRDLEPVEGLSVQVMHQEALIAALPGDHPLTDRRSVSLRELGTSAFVSLPRDRVPRAWEKLVVLCHQAQIKPRIAQEANQFVTLLALVAAGLGVAVIPESVRSMRHHGIHYVRLRDPGTSTNITTAVRADDHDPVTADLHALLHSSR